MRKPRARATEGRPGSGTERRPDGVWARRSRGGLPLGRVVVGLPVALPETVEALERVADEEAIAYLREGRPGGDEA